VKRYSSGMYVRLAFAVAAFLEPEILIVDEALAVGDAQFRAKCLRRIRDIIDDGRTLLFVSHMPDQVREVCRRCIVLRAGRVVFDGPTEEALSLYNPEAATARAVGVS
jgi:lipopolysaccharide transport system ATP-binding protein